MADVGLAGKRVMIREDLNVPVDKGVVTSDARIRAALPTLRYAMQHGAKVIILSHLADNSVAHGAQTFTVSALAGDDMLRILVTDDGSGISVGNRDRIFEPFFTTKEVGKGTGLGCAISYAIVQQHRGNIAVDSTPGKGATFTITLPAV
mgnify:CR=1 FL=1